MNSCSVFLLIFLAPYFYIKFHDDLHPKLLWGEHSRRMNELIAEKKDPRKPGPMYDDCNLCVWKYCSPSLKTPSEIEFSPENDGQKISKALKDIHTMGLGNNLSEKAALIEVLAARTEKQRLTILADYQKNKGVALSASFTDGNYKWFENDFKKLLYYLSLPLEDFYASQFKKGIDQLKSKIPLENKEERRVVRKMLLELFASLPSCLLKKIFNAYHVEYKQEFTKDLKGALTDQPQSDVIDVFLDLATTPRNDGASTDWFLAWKDAKKLRKAVRIQDMPGTKKYFREVFTKRSILQVRETVILYEKLRKMDPGFTSIYQDIRNNFQGAVDIFTTIAKVAVQKQAYFTDAFVKMMNEIQPNSKGSELLVFLRAHCGIDLRDITKEYVKSEKTTVIDTLKNKQGTTWGPTENIIQQIVFAE